MDVELLNRLRQASQDLLHRLRMKQEEIRKGLPSKQLLPASLQSSTAADRCVPSPSRVVCVVPVLEIQGSKQVSMTNSSSACGVVWPRRHMDMKELLENGMWNMESVRKGAALWLLFILYSQSVLLAKGLEIHSCLRKASFFF